MINSAEKIMFVSILFMFTSYIDIVLFSSALENNARGVVIQLQFIVALIE